MRPRPLRQQLGESRNVAVALDERWARSNPRDKLSVEVPHELADRLVMAIDQKASFGIRRMTGEMNFADAIGRDRFEPFNRAETGVVSPHGDIVHVDQQAAAAAARKLREEARLAPA